jgi:hypothetical protein
MWLFPVTLTGYERRKTELCTGEAYGEGLELEGASKKRAILIAVLAAILAVTEMGAKSSQTHVLTEQVESSDLWSFYQAKTMRQTIIRTAAEEVEARYKDGSDMPAAVKAQAEAWKRTTAR